RPVVNSMVIKTGRKLSRSSLELFLNEWAPKAYRIKGFVNLKEGKTAAVQCTFNSIEIIEKENAFHPTELVAMSDQFTLQEWNLGFKEMGKIRL
ncbi:MAG: GTP-binding protein, partial [Bacteroidetes bacterium]|nr:GTP-binding protein [Bacteroidota bacterium]